MTREHDDRALIEDIKTSWAPAPTDPDRFAAQLQRRLHGRQRRRQLLVVGLAAAGLLVAASHLLGGLGPVEEVVLTPAPVEESSLALAADTEQNPFFADVLDHEQRGFSLPGAYGALDSLFVQPYDQEL